MTAEEPDGGNLLVRIRWGPRASDRPGLPDIQRPRTSGDRLPWHMPSSPRLSPAASASLDALAVLEGNLRASVSALAQQIARAVVIDTLADGPAAVPRARLVVSQTVRMPRDLGAGAALASPSFRICSSAPGSHRRSWRRRLVSRARRCAARCATSWPRAW